jgi:microcystin-dependent protein
MNATITGINNIVPGQLTVRSNISSQFAPSTFDVNEIGIFGTVGAQPETLVAYAAAVDDSGNYGDFGDNVIPTGGGTPLVKDYALLMIFQQAISSSGEIELVQVVGLHAATHLDNGVDPIPVATTSRTGSLRALSGNSYDVLLGTGVWGSQFLPGFVQDYAGASAPSGWLLCDGASYNRADYPDLFSVITDNFGAVDGSSFNVPDLRGRVSVGAGQGTGLTNRVLSDQGGEESHVLSTAELPSHSHGITDSGHTHVVNDPQHTHTVSDPGHVHSISDPGHGHAIIDPGHYHSYINPAGEGLQFSQTFGNVIYNPLGILNTSTEHTNISIVSASTNISVSSHGTGITIPQVSTGISINSHVTGITINNTGSDTGHNTMPPYVVLTKIIKF